MDIIARAGVHVIASYHRPVESLRERRDSSELCGSDKIDVAFVTGVVEISIPSGYELSMIGYNLLHAKLRKYFNRPDTPELRREINHVSETFCREHVERGAGFVWRKQEKG